ncbi:MAG: N-acetyltransferase [Bacteroidia bacterium]|nr:N-acetyltransferase [Bacteroidia bacterium]
MIRIATPNDAQRIAEIYNYYITNTTVTFEEEPVSAEIMKERISEVQQEYPWLVYEKEGRVVAYAYAGAWKSRCAYRYSVETSVYLEHGLAGKGIGSELYKELLSHLQGLNLHGIIGGIALPNEACIALHEKFGFEKVAHFKEVGHKFNKWIDVTYYEKIL